MNKKRSHSDMTQSPRTSILQTSTDCSTMEQPEEDDKHLYVVLCSKFRKMRTSLHKINLTDLVSRFKSSTPRQTQKPLRLPEPMLELSHKHFPDNAAFFAAGSKIYIFGGGSHRRPILKCYSFETCRNKHGYKVLKETPRMCRGKHSPIVMGPLNGKLYVLSNSLDYFDFEEFNVETECWTLLPQPRLINDSHGGPHDFDVLTNSVTGNNLILSTSNGGIYMYDVVSGSWEVFHRYDDKLCRYFREPLGFRFGWHVLHRGLRKVYADENNFGRLVYRPRVKGSHVLEREHVIMARKHDVLRLEKSDTRLCIVSSGDLHSRRFHRSRRFPISVDLCRIGGLRVSEHYYATFYTVEDEEGVYMDTKACFVI